MAWNPDGTWSNEDDSVASNLTGLLASDSKYITTARAAGERTANKRGLLNSSIAAGSAESAAIGAAAPIASQDASQNFQRNQAVLEGGINFDNQSRLNTQQNDFTQTLQDSAAGDRLNEQDRAAVIQRERDELINNNATATQLREFDQRTAEQERNIASELERQGNQLSSSERMALLSSDTALTQSQIAANSQLSSQYLGAFSNLAQNPDIPADVRNSYITEFQRVMAQGQSLINAVSGAQVQWSGGTQTAPAAQPTQQQPYVPNAPATAGQIPSNFSYANGGFQFG